MSADTILAELRQERAVKTKERDALSNRIDQLTTAIDALEGKTGGVNGVQTPVVEVVERAAKLFTQDRVFEIQDVRRKAVELRPDMEGRLTRGVYAAIAQLKKTGVVRTVPGGLMLNGAH
jgi:hypothetical protein